MASPPPDPSSEPCIHCGGTDFLPDGFGPRTLVLCTACGDVGTHVACEAEALGVEELDEDMVDAPWFCGEVRGGVAWPRGEKARALQPTLLRVALTLASTLPATHRNVKR